VVTVGFYWSGEQFVISTAATAPKVGALSARPDIALAIDTGGTPEQARATSVRGAVAEAGARVHGDRREQRATGQSPALSP
jgi:hypothetical protein